MNHTQTAMRNHTSVLETELAEKDATLAQLSAETQRLSEEKDLDNSVYVQRISNLEENLETAKLQLESSTNRLNQKDEEIGKLQQELSGLNHIIGDLQGKLSQVQGKDLDVDKKLVYLSELNKQLEDESSSLKLQLSTQASLVGSFQLEVKEKGQQVEVLNKELHTFKMAAEEMQTEVEKLKEYYRVGEERRHAEVENLQKALDEVLSERNDLRRKLLLMLKDSDTSLDTPQLTSSPLSSVSVSSFQSGVDQVIAPDSMLERYVCMFVHVGVLVQYVVYVVILVWMLVNI